MTTTFPMYAEAARLEVHQRLRDADDQRRRRLARRHRDAVLRPREARR
jgi:hypothetical protein